MKSFIITIALLSMVGGVSYYEHNYTRSGCEVVRVYEDVVTVKDSCGFLWDVEAEDLKVGCKLDLKMHDNGTNDCVYDDIITNFIIK